ncbi:hypothetical protein [Sphingomonas baiyangensis]|uniref:Uncharacterized protein n=1 Tax=Sphingomonas baiyangensis TaxID=2572576 RepID=A0A4U1L794_9SPHN|nr:hypothetical protein [Sphingomonas baiyangensis]TKD52827.1 hypothetical protein FBR43_00225 [Sphingomonas baiyangensis]
MVGIKWGALIGGALDASDGDDSPLDGALKGAIIGGVLRVAVPIAFTYAVGWLVLKGLSEGVDALGDAVSGDGAKAASD